MQEDGRYVKSAAYLIGVSLCSLVLVIFDLTGCPCVALVLSETIASQRSHFLLLLRRRLLLRSIHSQKVMLDAPPGGALTLTDVPLTLFPNASNASATPCMLLPGTAPEPTALAEDAELAPPPATLWFWFWSTFSSSSVPQGDWELTAEATPPAGPPWFWFWFWFWF